jgi:hypothetical protein
MGFGEVAAMMYLNSENNREISNVKNDARNKYNGLVAEYNALNKNRNSLAAYVKKLESDLHLHKSCNRSALNSINECRAIIEIFEKKVESLEKENHRLELFVTYRKLVIAGVQTVMAYIPEEDRIRAIAEASVQCPWMLPKEQEYLNDIAENYLERAMVDKILPVPYERLDEIKALYEQAKEKVRKSLETESSADPEEDQPSEQATYSPGM